MWKRYIILSPDSRKKKYMKVSYNTLKKYLPYIGTPEEVAEDLVMHTAEIEHILWEWDNLKDVYVGYVKKTRKHPQSDRLNICQVEVCWEEKQIVCGAPNVAWGQKVPVAVVGTKLSEDFEIKKVKILWETSEGMICASDEIWLTQEKQKVILELPADAPMWVSLREYLKKDNAILEIDNKAINHRPDLFSHIGVIRELATIEGKQTPLCYEKADFWKEKAYPLKNEIPEFVARYIALSISGVENSESPKEIKDFIEAIWNSSKGILVDITNYSLSLYGQPTHCFDRDKIVGGITVRFAKNDEKFLALDDKEYELSNEDIVIADDEKILALWGIIGGKESSVSDTTENIVIEGANFSGAILRKTGRRLGIRTDALNLFEKNIPQELALYGVSLIYKELSRIFPQLKIIGYAENYEEKQKQVYVPYDKDFINKLIGSNYSEVDMIEILKNLGIEKSKNNLSIPFWRTDITNKADIAEEIARIKGYDQVQATIPSESIGAVVQDSLYYIKNDVRSFFTDRGFFDMYTYSFVNEELIEKTGASIDNCIEMKNYLSEEITHLRPSIIPNLLLSIEKNQKEFKNLKLFEIEKVFENKDTKISEKDSLAWIISSEEKTLLYYEIQDLISSFLESIGVDKYEYKKTKNTPSFAHKWRTADIIVRGQAIGTIWEISPAISKNFDINARLAFFEIDIKQLASLAYNRVKAKTPSAFQENSFDLSFVLDKQKEGQRISKTIEKTSPFIQKVELFDIYENEEKLPWKRSLSFKIYIQSEEETLSDTIKNELIETITKQVEKQGWTLRN